MTRRDFINCLIVTACLWIFPILACGLQAQLPISESTPIPATETPYSEKTVLSASPTLESENRGKITIIAPVYKRDYAGVVRGSLKAGDVVPAWCGLELCYLQGADAGLTIWRGCTDQAGGRKCQPK